MVAKWTIPRPEIEKRYAALFANRKRNTEKRALVQRTAYREKTMAIRAHHFTDKSRFSVFEKEWLYCKKKLPAVS